MTTVAQLLGVGLPLYLGGLHAWLFLHRRRERGHALVAAAALGVAGLAAAHALPLPFAVAAAAPLCVASGVLVRRFVRAMREAEQLATRQAERIARRARELRTRDLRLAEGQPLASLGALAAGVGRATLEPLAALDTGLARVRDAWHDPEATVRVPRTLEACRRHAEQLRAIVSRVLSVARHGDRVLAPVDLHEAVREVLPLLEPIAHGRARISTQLDAVPPVHGDLRLLGQVILQLGLNAVQALPQRPDGLASGDVRISLRTREDQVELRVEDTGAGLAPEVLPRVFDPFFTPEGDEPGPVWSLAMVHQIVASHGGRVELASDSHGTQVVVTLPRRPGAAAPLATLCAPAPSR